MRYFHHISLNGLLGRRKSGKSQAPGAQLAIGTITIVKADVHLFVDLSVWNGLTA